MTALPWSTTLLAMQSVRCKCGRVFAAQTGEALLADVEKHVEEVLAHTLPANARRATARLRADAQAAAKRAAQDGTNKEER